MTQPITFDIEDLTLGDVEYLIEQHGDDVLTQLQKTEDGTLPIRLLIDFVWRIMLHDDPEATREQAAKVKIRDLPSGDEDAEGKGEPPEPKLDVGDDAASSSS